MTKEKVRDALASLLGFKPVKTVRHKLLVIFTHILLWGLFLVLPLFIYRIRIPGVHFFYREIINKAFLIALFYFNFYYLLPRLFKNRRIFSYVLSLMAALIFLCVQQLILETWFLRLYPRRPDRFYPAGAVLAKNGKDGMIYLITLQHALSSGTVILLLSGFIKLAHSLFISEKQKKILENERLNAELNFLKLQINPHFLFNTLNSIYSQAHFKSEQTEHSILKFSRIMRYVLYDSTAEKISLSQDLEYISNYIDLQKLRLSKNITIHYDVPGTVNGLVIAPLLLITFIENAFKHGISYTAPSEIKIAIAVTGNQLLLTVGNAMTQSSREASGGVGLINAQRRLNVLYPGRHTLDVVENNHLYIVNLKIELDYES
jgi:two-component system, LytTR family, sensor kinase